MATQTLQDIINYYVGLLIIQYSGNQPKAQASINLAATTILCDGVVQAIQQAYNINPALGATAVGVQLDVIGKYVGINRFYTNIILTDYAAAVTYSQNAALPSPPVAGGLETYATFSSDFDYNGTLTYDEILTSQNQLSDADFLIFIQFMILCNNMNYSAYAIDNALQQTFGTQLRAESGGQMNVIFFLTGSISTLISTILFKKLFPVPMAMSGIFVQFIERLMFACTTYSEYNQGVFSPFGYGCSTYSNYGTLAGQTLTYSQISLAA